MRLSFIPRWSVMILLLCSPLHAQWAGGVQTLSVYDDNSFAYRVKKPDVYHQIFGSLSYDIETDYSFTQLFYYGAWVQFQRVADRTYHQHLAGAFLQMQLDGKEDEEEHEDEDEEEEEREGVKSEGVKRDAGIAADSLLTYLVVKPYVGARYDRSRWMFYDYRMGGVGATLRRHVAGPVMARLVADAEYKAYPFLNLFTHWEFNGGLVLSARVAEPVEVFAGGMFGYKEYTESKTDTTWVEVREGRRVYWQEVITTWEAPATQQLSLVAGLSLQPGGSWTGSLAWTKRINPESKARYLDREDLDYGNEDDVFDDRYGYESDELDLTATGPLFGPLTATVSALAYWKRYPRVATDMDGLTLPGDPKRKDRRWSVSAQVMYPILPAGRGFHLSVGGTYTYWRNESNNEYHDYHIHQIGLVVEAGW